MKKMIATAFLALTVAGSVLAPAGSVALAAMETEVDQTIVDSQSLTNIEYTLDNQQDSPSQQEPAPASPPPPDCGCMVVPAVAPAA